MKNIIVRTSDLGYSMDYYRVETNLNEEEIRNIEFKEIPCHRSASTTIKQLKKAVEDKGYIFNVEIIEEDLKELTEEVKNLKVDYEAHYGNY